MATSVGVDRHDSKLKGEGTMSPEREKAHRIVVGIDGSVSSIAALEWAADQAELTGSALEVLVTWEWPYGYGWAPVPNNYDPAHDARKFLTDALVPISGGPWRHFHSGDSPRGSPGPPAGQGFPRSGLAGRWQPRSR